MSTGPGNTLPYLPARVYAGRHTQQTRANPLIFTGPYSQAEYAGSIPVIGSTKALVEGFLTMERLSELGLATLDSDTLPGYRLMYESN